MMSVSSAAPSAALSVLLYAARSSPSCSFTKCSSRLSCCRAWRWAAARPSTTPAASRAAGTVLLTIERITPSSAAPAESIARAAVGAPTAIAPSTMPFSP